MPVGGRGILIEGERLAEEERAQYNSRALEADDYNHGLRDIMNPGYDEDAAIEQRNRQLRGSE
jgi:hypothetical protein